MEPSREHAPSSGALRISLTRTVAILALAVSVAYLSWRLAETMAWSAWWVAVPMWLLEAYSTLGLFLFTASLWDVDGSTPPGPRGETALSLAVLIPTFNEPLDVLLPTVASAVALTPPHETWVLDDGDRPEVAELAAALGARYLARATNDHAKAGNVNHALGLGAHALESPAVEADLVAILDADHVAEAGLLADLLGYFDDPELALVQTPQEFYNTDSFEHTRMRWVTRRDSERFYNEQGLFYRAIQPGKNRWGGAFWCGTNAVIRVAALRAVGGVATETLTEDLHTTVRLHRAGWKTRYHNEVLARGLAASDARQYQKQRMRWGTGSMQLLRSRENPLTATGLSLGQRVTYAATLLGWFDAWRSLGFVLLPLVVVATGVPPVHANAWVFGAAFAATFTLQQTALRLLGRGHAPQGVALVFEMLRMQVNLAATLTIFGRRDHKFTVTPKGASASGRSRRNRAPMLLLILQGLTVGALLWFALTEAHLDALRYRSQAAVCAAAGWAVLSLTLMALAVRRVRAERFAGERRASVRFHVRAPGRLGEADCTAVDVSLTGASLTVAGNRTMTVGDELPLSVWIRGRLFACTVTLRTVAATEDGLRMGIEFTGASVADRAELALALFRTTQYELVETGVTAPLSWPAAGEPDADLDGDSVLAETDA